MTERDEWAALLTHPGYLRLLERARQEWVVGYPGKVKRAIHQAVTDQTDVGAAVLSVDAANEAVNALLSWPEARMQQLDLVAIRDTAKPSPARGGR